MLQFLSYLGGIVRIFWVCRVSIADAAVGLAFFGLIVQAQNLMVDLSPGALPATLVFWTGVFAFTFLLWAFPVHFGARRSLAQLGQMKPELKGSHGWLFALLPRLLGLMPFLALALAIAGARNSLRLAEKALDAASASMTLTTWLYVADAVTAVAFVVFVWFRRRIVPEDWTGRWLHPVASVATGLVFVLAYCYPVWTSVHFPRALLVPPLFGSLVLVASWLTRLGDRTGFPLLATGCLVLGLLTAFNTDFNRLRTRPNTDGDQRMTVAEAVQAWRQANGCDKSGPCYRPLVVAIDGGASRAAFTAATFVGDLLDRMPKPADAGSASPGRRIFAMSGVSGGAYGAAVVQSALADAQILGDAMKPPCRSAQTTWFDYDNWQKKGQTFTWRQCLQALTSGDYLSTTIIGLAFRDFFAPPWQTVGLPRMEDRAALLERTWERQYKATLEDQQGFYEGGSECARESESDSGFCRRAAHPAAFFKGSSPGSRWMPMLLLNSTSVATGRRVISSDLASTNAGKDDKAPGGALYSQAYDLREAMSDQCKNKPAPIDTPDAVAWRELERASRDDASARTLTEGVCAKPDNRVAGPDVLLSTAALTSARFPIISPAGIFEMDGTIYGDQVVDGGYFENSGLTTAVEIADALRREKLDPIVVSISNNPAYGAPTPSQREACEARFAEAHGNKAFSPAYCTGLLGRPAIGPLEPAADNTYLGRFFSLFLRPFQTLIATGDGHADEVVASILSKPEQNRSFVHLKVEVTPKFADAEKPETMLADPSCADVAGKHLTMSQVSMSWWLAAAVQADLDIQRCALVNREEMKRLYDLMKEKVAPPS